MNQEDRQLLLKDLCARLPYGVVVETQLVGMPKAKYPVLKVLQSHMLCDFMQSIENVIHKPYLRPLSSMTEEEKKKFDDFCVIDEFVFMGDTEIGHKNQAIIMSDGIDYLNSIHVDYRGLIPKCLAIEVTKENNPYEKIKL